MQTLDMKTGKPVEDKDNPIGPQRPVPDPKNHTVDFIPPGIADAAKQSRQKAIEFITLLGAMYQAKRRNPQVQMTPPLMVTQSENKDEMMDLFKAAKDQDLPHLAKMSEVIRKSAATPGSQNVGQPKAVHGGAAAQEQPAQAMPGETPAQAKVRQGLTSKLQQATQQLPQASLKILRDLLSKSVKKKQPSPMQAGATNKPVITQG
jgi:hypothetical protein